MSRAQSNCTISARPSTRTPAQPSQSDFARKETTSHVHVDRSRGDVKATPVPGSGTMCTHPTASDRRNRLAHVRTDSAAFDQKHDTQRTNKAGPVRQARSSCVRSTSSTRSSNSEVIRHDVQQLMDDYFENKDAVTQQQRQEQSGGQQKVTIRDGKAQENVHSPMHTRREPDAATTYRINSSGDSYYYKKRSQSTRAVEPSLLQAWRRGPIDSAGSIIDVSERNLLCMDVLPSTSAQTHTRCVVGSADHGLVVLDAATKQKVKTLYSKTGGHTEWVTSCAFVPTTGQVVSGGMDSKVCLWSNVSTAHGPPAQCVDLLGHTGSVSMVDVSSSGALAISSSYDRTLRLWDIGGLGTNTSSSTSKSLVSRSKAKQQGDICSSGGSEVGCLSGHRSAVMQFVWSEQQLLSGDRGGAVKLWDVSTAQCLRTVTAKRGQISALGHLYADEPLSHVVMMGDQGGVLTVLDARNGGRALVAQHIVHPGGALTDICVLLDGSYVVTSGADRCLRVLEPRKNFTELCAWTDHTDYIYSLQSMGSLVLSGAGNGWLLVHDVLHINGSNDRDAGNPRCCYGLGAHTAAVRKICVDSTTLITAADDGKVNILNY